MRSNRMQDQCSQWKDQPPFGLAARPFSFRLQDKLRMFTIPQTGTFSVLLASLRGLSQSRNLLLLKQLFPA